MPAPYVPTPLTARRVRARSAVRGLEAGSPPCTRTLLSTGIERGRRGFGCTAGGGARRGPPAGPPTPPLYRGGGGRGGVGGRGGGGRGRGPPAGPRRRAVDKPIPVDSRRGVGPGPGRLSPVGDARDPVLLVRRVGGRAGTAEIVARAGATGCAAPSRPAGSGAPPAGSTSSRDCRRPWSWPPAVAPSSRTPAPRRSGGWIRSGSRPACT